MPLTKKLFFVYVLACLSYSYAMEFKQTRQDPSVTVAKKGPKLLQNLCLDSFYKSFFQNYNKKEDITILLQELKRLNIPEILDQKMAMRLLSLSNCTLKLLPDKIIQENIGSKTEIITVYAAQFYPLTNSVICAYKNKNLCFLGLWSLAYKKFFPCKIQNKFNCIGFSGQADYIVLSYYYKNNSIIEVCNTAPLMDNGNEFLVCNAEVKQLYFSDDDKYIIAIFKEGKKIWDRVSKEEMIDESVFPADIKKKIFGSSTTRMRLKHAIQQLSLSQSSIRAVHAQKSNKKINFVARSGRLITLKSTKNKLDNLLQGCSLETAAQLIHLSECEKNERCLSCKKIALDENIKKLLLHKSAVVSKCDLCKENNAELNL